MHHKIRKRTAAAAAALIILAGSVFPSGQTTSYYADTESVFSVTESTESTGDLTVMENISYLPDAETEEETGDNVQTKETQQTESPETEGTENTTEDTGIEVTEDTDKNTESGESSGSLDTTYTSYTCKAASGTLYTTCTVTVRSGPAKSHDAVGTLSAGSRVSVSYLCTDTGWYKITCGSINGWCDGDCLSSEKPSSSDTETEDSGYSSSARQGVSVTGGTKSNTSDSTEETESTEDTLHSASSIPSVSGRTTQLSAGSTLTGNDAIIYAAMKEQFTAAAFGRVTSTEFTVELTMTLEELGVEDRSGAIYKTNDFYSMKKVYYALYMDCPFELYWYDVDTYRKIKKAYSYPDEEHVTLELTWCIPVLSAYAGEDEYTIDPEKTKRAVAAYNNAAAIAAKYEGKSDAEKLAGFAREILDLVEYENNHSSIGYGDIYSIVYVFDNDQDTNVVCKAYAKAYQLLCSFTTFDNAACYFAYGYMGSSCHAWNVVSIGGTNYMLDLTAVDQGMEWLWFALPVSYDGTTYTFRNPDSGARGLYYYSDNALLVMPEAALKIG